MHSLRGQGMPREGAEPLPAPLLDRASYLTNYLQLLPSDSCHGCLVYRITEASLLARGVIGGLGLEVKATLTPGTMLAAHVARTL
jgi:hypothetical protein